MRQDNQTPDTRSQYKKDIDNNISIIHNIRDTEFKRMMIGYHGTLSRHGDVLIITIPFVSIQIAKNAEKAILGID